MSDLKRISAWPTHIRALAHRHWLQLILSVRVTVSALAALGLAQMLNLKLPLWAVLTALIVTQMSVGRSLKVATDYLMGTLIGVFYGGALAILIPHESEWALFVVLALAVAPLAFVAAFKANFNVLPITAIIVLLVPSMQHVSPVASAVDRVLEVTVGGIGGFIVSFFVFPSRAHALTTEAAADTFELVAMALSQLLEHHCGGEQADVRRINAQIGALLTRLNASGAEAEHERTARLTSGPDTGPLLRTLLRLRHDIVILGRAVGCELPDAVQSRLEPPLQQISAPPPLSCMPRALGSPPHFRHAAAAALRARIPPPPLDAIETAFGAYTDEFGEIRHAGLTRDMTSEAAERLFALGFALEQMREPLGEVPRVV